jgi:hypothetical protein
MGACLVCEGILSACYHICPTGINFQFDTTFMFAMSLLIFLKVYQFRHLRITPPATLVGLLLGTILYVEVLGYLFDQLAFWVAFVCFYMVVTNYIILKIYRSDELDAASSPPLPIKTTEDSRRLRVNIKKYDPTSAKQTETSMTAVWSWLNIRTRPVLAVGVANLGLGVYILVCHTPGVSTYILLILSMNMALYLVFYLSCKMYYR